MLSLSSSSKLLCPDTAFQQVGRALTHVVRIGGQNVHKALSQHALSPIAGTPAEASKQRAGGDLHPDAALCQPLDDLVFALDPGKPLGMGQHRYVAGEQDIEKKL